MSGFARVSAITNFHECCTKPHISDQHRTSLGITWNPELIWNKSVPLFESVSKSGTLLSYNTLILLMFTFVLVPGGSSFISFA
jgi:hypothetical protein